MRHSTSWELRLLHESIVASLASRASTSADLTGEEGSSPLLAREQEVLRLLFSVVDASAHTPRAWLGLDAILLGMNPPPTEGPAQKGLKSEAMRVALDQALRGRLDDLQALLAHYGNMPSPSPNLELAAAFGVEVAAQTRDVTALLATLAATPSEADTADVFVPIAAAYGWVALARSSPDSHATWNAVHDFLADERTPVRVGIRDALVRHCSHPYQADRLLAQALRWMDEDGEEPQFGVAAVLTEIFSKKTIITKLTDPSLLREFLSRVLAAVAQAPRSASRWDSYRRLLAALPPGIAACVASAGSASALALAAHAWLKNECTLAREESVRGLLSETIIQLRAPGHGLAAGQVDALHAALAAGTKLTRRTERMRPGQGRGKLSRQTK
jgi:hypothetical protein